jgi:hypothetical protein
MTVPTSPGPRPRLHPFTVVDEFRALKARLRKLESFNKPGWIAITGAAGFTPQTFGYAPAYTLFPNGRVELRGIFVKSAAFSATSTTVCTLPSEAWPSQTIEIPCTLQAQGSTAFVARFEISAAGVCICIMPSPWGGTWVSLDGIFYYKD